MAALATEITLTLTIDGCVGVGDEIDLRDTGQPSRFSRGVVGVVQQVTPTSEGNRIKVRLADSRPTSVAGRVVSSTIGAAMCVGLASLVCVLGVNFAISPGFARVNRATSEGLRAPGPWGQLEFTRIDIEPGVDLIPSLAAGRPRWFFETRSRDVVMATLRDAKLSPEAIKQCAAQGVWESEAGGLVLEPPLDVALTMSPGSRENLYKVLARLPKNADQRNPIPVSTQLIGALAQSGLAAGTISKFTALLYGTGPWRLFSDLPAMLMSLPDEHERSRFATVLVRTESYILRLKIDATTDVDALLRYWIPEGPTEDVRPLLESLTRTPGGSTVGVLRLLSAFSREHANRYPHPGDPIESRADCFWTALNFSSGQTLAPVDDPGFVFNTLKSNFHPTNKQPRVGNLVVLLNQRGAPVHAAVYLADGFVFTKNGQGVIHPWTIMTLDSMVTLYTALAGNLRVVTLTNGPVVPQPRDLALGH